MYHILLCDDEEDIVNALEIYLNQPDYCFYKAYDGQKALEIARERELQLILMDVMMPRMDGLEAMNQIRQFSNVPIILLTAKGEDIDKIQGLNAGADDYITKPFNPMEVCARVRSQLRRYLQLGSGSQQKGILKIGGIQLDDVGKKVMLDGEEASLTPTEYEILKLLMENPGKVFSPAEIYRHVWKDQPIGSESTVAVHIRHLREKVEINPADPRYLKVVWGQGYKMDGGIGT
ncbi:MAG: response regulator transcription factor [Acetatifactor sp.]|nr:response regulator transcription factor [Acetatifactor sp.]